MPTPAPQPCSPFKDAFEAFQKLGPTQSVIWDELGPISASYREVDLPVQTSNASIQILEGRPSVLLPMADGSVKATAPHIVRWAVRLDTWLDMRNGRNAAIYFDSRTENSEWIFANLNLDTPHLDEKAFLQNGGVRTFTSYQPAQKLNVDEWLTEIRS